MIQNATFIIGQPGRRKRSIAAADKIISIGRAIDNIICLEEDTNVSRYHAVIARRDDGFWLTDLGGRNGTTVNGEVVNSERKLHDGDLIHIGGTSTIEFRSLEERADDENDAEPEISAAPQLLSATSEETASEKLSSASTPQQSRAMLSAPMLGIFGGLILAAIIVAILYAISGMSIDSKPAAVDLSVQTKASPTPTVKSDEPASNTSATLDLIQSSEGNAQSTPEADTTRNTEALASAAQILAAKISPKNYVFDPEFVALINHYVNEYKTAAGFHERARKYRDAIEREFINVQGIPPVFGYVLAMSRTKFIEGTDGVWQMPTMVIKDEGMQAPVANLSDPTVSTKIAASYVRGLWDVFGREGFMYSVACYGMTLDEAGQLQQALEIKDPTGEVRFDFWRMKNAGVVKGQQIERVARFFAAGIVAENPQQFGLKEQPLSSLF